MAGSNILLFCKTSYQPHQKNKRLSAGTVAAFPGMQVASYIQRRIGRKEQGIF